MEKRRYFSTHREPYGIPQARSSGTRERWLISPKSGRWSGNWRITVEQTAYRQVRVTGGFNSFDFAYPLAGGESLETPMFYGGYSHAGFGGASRMLHRFEREQILPGGLESRLRPVAIQML